MEAAESTRRATTVMFRHKCCSVFHLNNCHCIGATCMSLLVCVTTGLVLEEVSGEALREVI